MRIQLVSIYVDDPVGKAYRFYTETLGFVSKVYMPEHYVAMVASSEDPDGTTILLEPNDNPIAGTYQKALYDANLPCMVFGTDKIHEEYERLTAAGVVFRQPPTKTEWNSVEAVFEDTCGNLIQLAQV
jgi:catechol 2,3-dioxygenase-like lactoylglutathione lyase family enzyme